VEVASRRRLALVVLLALMLVLVLVLVLVRVGLLNKWRVLRPCGKATTAKA
jgi:hypothetical protein